jgi:hypothetical protein
MARSLAKGSKGEYLAIAAATHRAGADASKEAALRIPGANRVETVCAAKGGFTSANLRRLLAEVALANGQTLDDVLRLPVEQAADLLIGAGSVGPEGVKPDPFDRALIDLLTRLSGTWQSLDLDSFTHAQEKALTRLTKAGLVEERLDVRVTMRGFPQQVTMRCRVTGRYDDLVMQQVFDRMPEWLMPDGSTRDRTTIFADSVAVRLTTDGERGKRDFLAGEGRMVLSFLRGANCAAGHCGVEDFSTINQGADLPEGQDRFDLIERLLAGPPDAELTPRDLALLDAYLHNHRPALSELADGNSKYAKLRMIRDFNRTPANVNSAATPPPTDRTGEAEGDAAAGSTPTAPADQEGQRRKARRRKIDPDRERKRTAKKEQARADKRLAEAWKGGKIGRAHV